MVSFKKGRGLYKLKDCVIEERWKTVLFKTAGRLSFKKGKILCHLDKLADCVN